MKDEKRRRYSIKVGVCCLLLAAIGLISAGAYKRFPMIYEEKITIGVFSDSYWDVQNGYSYRILDDAIELFKKQHPGVAVEYVSGIMKEDYPEWLSEQILKGEAPDLFFLPAEHFNDFAGAGALKDLTSLIEKDKDFFAESFYSSAYECGKYEGIQYALPYECAPKLMFVNRSILLDEGISIPDREWTWEEFYDICSRVTKDTDGNGTADQFGMTGYTWEDAFDSNGVRLFNEEGTECYLTDGSAVDGIAFIEKLERLNNRYNVTDRDFALGNVAFQPMLFSEYRAYKSYPLSIKKYSGFEWDCVAMPAGPNGDNVSRLDTISVAMSASTVHEEYAWDMMCLLTGDEQIQSEIFDYSEGVPVLKDVVESGGLKGLLVHDAGEGIPLDMEVLRAALEHATVTPRFRSYDDAVAEVGRAVRAIIEGNSNINMETIIQNRNINNYLKGKH